MSHRIVNVVLTWLGQGHILLCKESRDGSFWLLFSKTDFSVSVTIHLNLIDCLLTRSYANQSNHE